jgi:hypothetical protein
MEIVYILEYRLFQKELYIVEILSIYSGDLYSVLNCYNVTTHTEFYLG